MFDRLDRLVALLAKIVAWAGGLVLVGVMVMTVLSITGRELTSLGLGPINGDYEWLEMGMAFAIFAFLPWCAYQRGHARVDLLMPLYRPLGNKIIDLLSDILIAVVAVVIAKQLYIGMEDKLRYRETTFITQTEIWQSYAASLLGAFVFVIVAVFCVIRSIRAFWGTSA
jgi:TRAP-type C4-dicarboxylate transport system permease small subunit